MTNINKTHTSWIRGRTDDLNIEQADNADHTGTVDHKTQSVLCLYERYGALAQRETYTTRHLTDHFRASIEDQFLPESKRENTRELPPIGPRRFNLPH